MALHAFKPIKDRRRETWSPDDAERFGLLAQFLNEKHIAAVMRCAQPGCSDRVMKAIQQDERMVLRCGCTDRHLTDKGLARG